MEVNFKNGNKAVLIKIDNIKTYRGFYINIDDKFYENNFCTSNIVGTVIKDTGYSNGFETGDMSVVGHLFNLIKNKKKLNKNELIAFYEIVGLRHPVVRVFGAIYDFREILHKHQNIQFWTLSSKMSKREIEIYREATVYADEVISDTIENVTRVEVITDDGREFIGNSLLGWKLSLQDDNRTLKLLKKKDF